MESLEGTTCHDNETTASEHLEPSSGSPLLSSGRAARVMGYGCENVQTAKCFVYGYLDDPRRKAAWEMTTSDQKDNHPEEKH